MSDPQTIAQGITKAFMATDAGRFGICPVCAGIHRLTRSRTLVRHGFKARNVRRGQSSGFHIGGHAGQDPIGTALGNREAVMEAQRHHTTADRLAALPPVTAEEATQAYLQEIWENAMKSWSYRRVGDRPRRYETLADLQASAGGRSVMHWFSKEGLAYKAGRMTTQRAQAIEDHRAHADLLVALVTLNPD